MRQGDWYTHYPTRSLKRGFCRQTNLRKVYSDVIITVVKIKLSLPVHRRFCWSDRLHFSIGANSQPVLPCNHSYIVPFYHPLFSLTPAL